MDREDESIYLLDMSRCQPRKAIDSDFAPGGEFQKQHPEYRCVTPEGNRTRQLSHAFPAVRDQYVELFREWVDDYEADGACIIFCRSWPYVLYEEPVLESFERQHGLGMRDLPRNHPLLFETYTAS